MFTIQPLAEPSISVGGARTTTAAARPGINGVARRIRVIASDPFVRDGIFCALRNGPDPYSVSNDPRSCADVVLIVVDQINRGTIDAIRAADGSAIAVLVGRLEPDWAAAAISAGSSAVLPRDEVTPTALHQILASVLAGRVQVPPEVLAHLVDRSGRFAPGGTRRLSDRERRVLELVAEGSDTREVARVLCYAERTVKATIQAVTLRYGLRNRSHAVAFALRQGWI